MERMWYYAKSGSSQKEGPIAEKDLKSIISIGQLTNRDLVWSEGMKNWVTLDHVPELTPPGTISPAPVVDAILLNSSTDNLPSVPASAYVAHFVRSSAVSADKA